MRKKFLLSLAPVLMVAAVGTGASSAMATACTTTVLCNASNEALRDDAIEPPTGGGFGTDALAVNTDSVLRLCEKYVAGGGCSSVIEKTPQDDVLFGIKLHVNPKTSTTACEKAEGWVQWADIQNATSTGTTSSPMFAGTSASKNGPWHLTVWSDQAVCGTKAGTTEISKFAIYLPIPGWPLTTPATGAIKGTYAQPGANCAAGGVKLAVEQMLEINGTLGARTIDNGTTGTTTNVYLCFVSANNYVYPTTAPTWGPFTGAIWKD